MRAVIPTLFCKRFHSTIQRRRTGAVGNSNLIWPIRYFPVMIDTHDGNEIIDAGYVDTMDTTYEDVPLHKLRKSKTVLFLGNEHFMDNDNMMISLQKNLFKPLAENNCRVIAPFGLGSRYTDNKYALIRGMHYKQMLGERTQFLLDFLNQKDLNGIDLVIGHSLASYTAIALRMCWDKVRSLAVINPIPGNDAPNWIKPARLSFRLMDSYDKPLRPLSFLLSKLWIMRSRMLMGKELMGKEFTNKEAHHFAKVAHGINYSSIQSMAISISSLTSPFLYVGCRDDPTINKKDEEAFLKLMDILDEEIFDYDDNYEVQRSDPTTPPKMKVARLPGHSHFPFHDKNSSDVIVAELLALMDNYDKNYAIHKK